MSGHAFIPLRSNKTLCDVCLRTVGPHNRKRGAEVVFIQQPDRWVDGQPLMWWRTRLVGEAFDRVTGQTAEFGRDYILRLEEEPDGSIHVTTQGREKGGRRHSWFRPTDDFDRSRGVTRNPISDAQAYAMAWARRRFYTLPGQA